MKYRLFYLSKIKLLTLLMSFFFVNAVCYASAVRAEDQEEKVRQAVAVSVTELLEQFESERKYYDTDPDRFFKTMDDALSKIVDFRRIAARVMGKYARNTTKEQRDQFVAVFKKSLYVTYTKTLIESGVFKITVTKAQINSRSDDRANVDLEVVSDNGTVFPVVYAMHKGDDDKWMVENVVVFGVNVGLAFRDRFEAQMMKSRNNVDDVINTWSVDLDIVKPKEG